MTEAEIKVEAKYIHDTITILQNKIKNLYKHDVEVTLYTTDCEGAWSIRPHLVSINGLHSTVERLEKIKRHQY